MAFLSEGTPGADPSDTRRSGLAGVAGVDIAAGLTDFSRACLAAVVSISNVRPGGSISAAFSSCILGLLMAERRCTSVHTKGMSYGSDCRLVISAWRSAGRPPAFAPGKGSGLGPGGKRFRVLREPLRAG